MLLVLVWDTRRAVRYTQSASPPARGTEEGGWSKTKIYSSLFQ